MNKLKIKGKKGDIIKSIIPFRTICALSETKGMAISMKKNSGLIKIVATLCVIGLVFFLLNAFGLTDKLTDVKTMQAWFQSLGIWGYLAYILVYIVVAVFMLPASALTIIGGIAFGSIAGGLLSVTGATIGGTVAFIIARYVARDTILEKFCSNPIFKKIEEGAAKNGTNFLILTRLVPLFPYNVQNYAYGVTSINVFTFALVSFITMTPGSFIYAFLAGEIATNGFSIVLLVQFTIAGIVLFFISLIPNYFAKKKGIDI